MSQDKKGQRTKGNVKPSSSAKSAQLLSEYGYGNVGFIGFSDGEATDEMPSNFSVLLRRLVKKDATTKIKALKELQTLVLDHNEAEVLKAWPQFAKSFCRLSLDPDLKVREEAQNALRIFGQKLGRQMANELKILMPYWLMSQNDAYSSVSNAAKSAFEALFTSAEKREQAIALCEESTITECADILENVEKFVKLDIGSTSGANESKEDAAILSERIRASALRAVITVVKNSNDKTCSTESFVREKLLERPKFWELAKNKSMPIKSAWLELISEMINRHPNSCLEKSGQICPILVNNLEKQVDRAVCAFAWTSMLNFLEKFPSSFWQHVNLSKALLPKLWSILLKGGDGFAVVIGPSLQPLLNQILLKQDDRIMSSQFALNFMQYYVRGIHKLCSEQRFAFAEKCAFVKAYCDCLIYLCCKFSDDVQLINELLVEQFTPLLLVILPPEYPIQLNEYPILDYLSHTIDELLKSRAYQEKNSNFHEFYLKLLVLFEKSIIDTPNLNVNALLLPKLVDRPENRCFDLAARVFKEVWLKIGPSFGHSSAENLAQKLDFLKSVRAVVEVLPNEAVFDRLFESESEEVNFANRLFTILTALDQSDARLDPHCALLIGCLFKLFKTTPSDSSYEILRKCFDLNKPASRIACIEELSKCDTKFIENLVKWKAFDELFWRCFANLLDSMLEESDQRLDWGIFSRFLTCIHSGKSTVSQHLIDQVFGKLIDFLDTHGVNNSQILLKYVDFVLGISEAVFENSPESCDSNLAHELMLDLFDLTLKNLLNDELSNKSINLLKNVISSDNCRFRGVEDSEKPRLLNCVVNRLLDQLDENFRFSSLHHLTDTAFELLCALIDDTNAPSNSAGVNTIKLICTFLPIRSRVDQMFGTLFNDYRWKLNAQLSGRYPTLEFLSQNHEPVENAFSSDYGKALRFCAYISELCSKFVSSIEFFDSLDEILLPNFQVCVALLIFERNTVEFQIRTNRFEIMKNNNGDDRKFLDTIRRVWSKIIEENKLTLSQASFVKLITDSSGSNDLFHFSISYILNLKNKIDDVILCPSTWTEIPYDLQYFTLPVFPASVCDSVLKLNQDDAPCADLTKMLILASNCPDLHIKANLLSQFNAIQTKVNDKLLFSCELVGAGGDTLLLNIALMDFLCSYINIIDELEGSQIDTIFCATLGWLQTCAESVTDLANRTACLNFCVKSLRLFVEINRHIKSTVIDDDSTIISGEAGPSDVSRKRPNYVDDWKEFFLAACQTFITRIFCNFFDCETMTTSNYLTGYIRQQLAAAAISLDGEKFLEEADFSLILDPELDSLQYPEKYQSILLHLCPLLLGVDRPLKIGSYNVLLKVISKMYKFEEKNADDASLSQEQEVQFPSYLISNIEASSIACDNFAAPDDACSDGYSNEILCKLSGYLLSWKLLLAFFGQSVPTKNRPAYSLRLTNSGLLKNLLSIVFRILDDCSAVFPQKSRPLFFNECDLGALLSQGSDSRSLDERCFLEEADLDPAAPSSFAEIKHLACNAYFESVRLFPAAVRQWWNNLDKKMKAITDRFTSKYVSPLLCASELRNVSRGQKQYGKMTLFTRTGAKEIVAIYKFEDLNMELVVKLSPNYPLQPVNVEVVERVGVAKDKWRKWMLQLVVFLTHQNGSILDGLLLWKSCVDKHLEGVEECMICMMAVHGSSYQLPKITCKQCKKKFHAACLYKWFDTSNKSSCPLCRTEFG